MTQLSLRRHIIMKLKLLTYFIAFTASVNILADDNTIYAKAKSLMDSPASELMVTYNTSNVVDICPKGSVGCLTSARGGKIYMSENISEIHHDVVLFGLYIDYVQYNSDSRIIDSDFTCDSKVKFLESKGDTSLANVYNSQCNKLHQNLHLASR
jgi:hypothetical protein